MQGILEAWTCFFHRVDRGHDPDMEFSKCIQSLQNLGAAESYQTSLYSAPTQCRLSSRLGMSPCFSISFVIRRGFSWLASSTISPFNCSKHTLSILSKEDFCCSAGSKQVCSDSPQRSCFQSPASPRSAYAIKKLYNK